MNVPRSALVSLGNRAILKELVITLGTDHTQLILSKRIGSLFIPMPFPRLMNLLYSLEK